MFLPLLPARPCGVMALKSKGNTFGTAAAAAVVLLVGGLICIRLKFGADSVNSCCCC